MNKEENDKIQYTAADINRYLRGQMPAAEMYAIEKAALEDPFLADAIEGYNERMALPDKDVKVDLDELKIRLKNRIEPVNRVTANSTRWWRIAALILLLAGTGRIVYKVVSTSSFKGKSVLTKNETPVPDTITNSVPENNFIPVDTTAIALNERTGNTKPRFNAMDKTQEVLKSKKLPPQIQVSPSISSKPSPGQSYDSSSLKYDSEKDIAGIVTNPKSREEPAFVENKKVLRTMSPNEIASRHKAVKAEDVSIREQDAAPKIGFGEYDKYIEKYKRTDTTENQLHGDVVISFFVSRNGRLSNFKIEKSLSKSIDNEAIRVVKEGPAWKVLKNKKTKAKLTIRF